jgi:general secretion pathway protein H
MKETGFTLIEILVVLVILALGIGLIAAHRPMRSAALEMRGTAGQLVQTLRLAQARAIARDRMATVSLDPAHHGVRLDDGPLQPLPARLSAAIAAPVAIGASGQSGQIRFAPDGSSSGGTIALSDGQQRIRIDVDWLTGRVVVAQLP